VIFIAAWRKEKRGGGGGWRHLSASVKATIAAEMLPRAEVEARERQKIHGGSAPGKPAEITQGTNSLSVTGKAAEHVAKIVGVRIVATEICGPTLADSSSSRADPARSRIGERSTSTVVHGARAGVACLDRSAGFRVDRLAVRSSRCVEVRARAEGVAGRPAKSQKGWSGGRFTGSFPGGAGLLRGPVWSRYLGARDGFSAR
jgi:hypothetical protein